MREARAVILGVFVVLLVLLAINTWRRPGREFHRVGGYRVEIRRTENGGHRHVAFTVPMSALARLAAFSPVADFGGNMKADWGNAHITSEDILEAAAKSTPGHPGVIERDHSRIEVQSDGSALEIQVRDDWDKTVRVRIPRSLVEGLTKDTRISPRDILRRLDELGPGDVVTVRDGDEEVSITAEAR